MTQLQKTAAPNLPLAPKEYGAQYQDQLNNILRLYFNLLEGSINNVIGVRGGQYVQFPYGAVQRTTDKTFTVNTATQITFDAVDYLSGVVNNPGDGLAVEQNGIYNYQFSIQLLNIDSKIHSAWVWLRKNGVDIPGTGSKFDVPNSHGGVAGQTIAACNFYVDMEAGDTIEMWAAVSNVSVIFNAEAAQTTPFVMPAIPSVVATLTFVSAL